VFIYIVFLLMWVWYMVCGIECRL